MKKETPEYKFYQDEGHGWLEVPLSLIENDLDKYSSFSYKKGNMAYLEEDCDATAFWQDYKAKHNGSTPNIKPIYVMGKSGIRNYERLF